MVSGVPNPLTPDELTGIIAAGASTDGLTFQMDRGLAIAPDPSADAGGCDDRTVVVMGTPFRHIFPN
jgi:hypothetical protein